ncbi:trimeric intracellular cation channel family protein [Saccharophagus degradans]|uniref:Trimeric intracellular cation channel family protein n=1 Tax=Saccharophagus degradans TaxID=86304 RepID=A0AAW7XCC8_9GAMM|nr:trimeric intracellular cation channel family protein [Saccharophagus degradans]MDO6424226.1 trimeric intracellular cation channel family protein [Saccharophagus degradans]MDO6608273.1 trimeric intracellular cation channel family protein [Saccharophagus degradans]WGO96801.1 trimeric intracellular cation channel family protein [Saccharophagus degradans]
MHSSHLLNFISIADYFGTFVFAISGAIAARNRSFDIFGVVVVATLTSLGGGTIRDMLLGLGPAIWIKQPGYLIIVLSAVTFAALLTKLYSEKIHTSMIYLDAFGLSIFTLIGAQIAMTAPGTTLPIIVIMSVITGVAGGVLRDIICNEIPLIFRQEIYASASAFGALLYYILFKAQTPTLICFTVPILATLTLRILSFQKKWSLPVLGTINLPKYK